MTVTTRSISLQSLLQGYVAAAEIPFVSVSGLSLDSRKVTPGDAYFALQGTRAHGLDYAAEAISNGASAILSDQVQNAAAAFSTPVVHVPQLADHVGELAARYFDHPSSKLAVCGVTGTDGKTSVCRFIADALEQLGHKVGYIGTIGWGFGTKLEPNPLTTPDAISLQSMIESLYANGASFITLEVSSHALVQGRVNGVAFDVAVLTNLGRDHLDYHGDLANYKMAKSRLFDWPGLSAAVLNVDDELGSELSQRLAATMPVTGFSASGSGSSAVPTVSAQDAVATESGLVFTLRQGDADWQIRSALLGRFNIDNLLSCFAVLQAFGVNSDAAAATLTTISPVPGRMERFEKPHAAKVVVDFSHTPQALGAALDTLRSHCLGKLWAVFGCGGDRDPGKRPLMGEVAALKADELVITDDNPRTESSACILAAIVAGLPKETPHVVIADRRTAIAHAMQHAAPADWVLIAGKGHEDYQIVGTETLHFSDRETVQSLMRADAGGGNA